MNVFCSVIAEPPSAGMYHLTIGNRLNGHFVRSTRWRELKGTRGQCLPLKNLLQNYFQHNLQNFNY